MSFRSRWLLIALLCVPVVAGIVKWKWQELEAAYNDYYYPPPKGPAVTPLGEEILRAEDDKNMNRFLREYQRVQDLVDTAQQRGADVSIARGRLKDSTILARAGAFREGLSMLNMIEMSLPKTGTRVQPAPQGAGEESKGAPIEGRPVQTNR